MRTFTTRSFEQMRERGQSLASLWASQAAIYQRYGYAQASVLRTYSIDTVDIRLLRSPPEQLEVVRESATEAFDTLKEVYRQFAADRFGCLHRAKVLWQANALAEVEADGPVHAAIVRDGDNPMGYMVYTLRGGRVDHVARGQEIIVRDTAWLSADAYRALWAFIARHDLVGRVVSRNLPADDPSPELLAEPRLLRARDEEGSWFRIIDVETALAARGYSAPGTLVIDVPEDDLAPWNAGRFELSVDDEGSAAVRRVSSDADLTVPVKALASAFTGARPVRALGAWGLIQGTPAAIARADAMFATRFAPHTPDHF